MSSRRYQTLVMVKSVGWLLAFDRNYGTGSKKERKQKGEEDREGEPRSTIPYIHTRLVPVN